MNVRYAVDLPVCD